MDSEALAANPPSEEEIENAKVHRVISYLMESQFVLQKHSERPWGSFEVGFRKDGGSQWFQVPNCPHGWGFSLYEAGARVLITVVGNPDHEHFFSSFFGTDALEKLKQSISE